MYVRITYVYTYMAQQFLEHEKEREKGMDFQEMVFPYHFLRL